jgi:hypothetical protein
VTSDLDFSAWEAFFGARRVRLVTQLSVEACVSRLKAAVARPDFLADSSLSAQVNDFGGVFAKTSITRGFDRYPEVPAELSFHFEEGASGSIIACRFDPSWTLRIYMSLWLAGASVLAAMVSAVSLASGDPRAWLGLLGVLVMAAIAILLAFMQRWAAQHAERFLLRILEAALDAGPMDGGLS